MCFHTFGNLCYLSWKSAIPFISKLYCIVDCHTRSPNALVQSAAAFGGFGSCQRRHRLGGFHASFDICYRLLLKDFPISRTCACSAVWVGRHDALGFQMALANTSPSRPSIEESAWGTCHCKESLSSPQGLLNQHFHYMIHWGWGYLLLTNHLLWEPAIFWRDTCKPYWGRGSIVFSAHFWWSAAGLKISVRATNGNGIRRQYLGKRFIFLWVFGHRYYSISCSPLCIPFEGWDSAGQGLSNQLRWCLCLPSLDLEWTWNACQWIWVLHLQFCCIPRGQACVSIWVGRALQHLHQTNFDILITTILEDLLVLLLIGAGKFSPQLEAGTLLAQKSRQQCH